MRTERYKYIHYLELLEIDELHDLQEDPYEMNNLFNRSAAQPVLQQMKQELAGLLQATGASE